MSTYKKHSIIVDWLYAHTQKSQIYKLTRKKKLTKYAHMA